MKLAERLVLLAAAVPPRKPSIAAWLVERGMAWPWGVARPGLVFTMAALLVVGMSQQAAAAPPDSFTVSPASLSINAEVGETRTASVTVTTKKPLVIEEPAATGDARFFDTLDGTCWQSYLSQGLRIPGKGSCTVSIGFMSTTPGSFTATLRVAQCTAWHTDASGALRCDATAGFRGVSLTGTASGQADLTLTEVTAGSTGTAPFTWAATVTNAGSATLNVKNVAIAASYSTDASPGGDSAACGGVVSSGNLLLAAGATQDVAFTCAVPPPPGTSHLVASVDGPSAVAEADETNNTSVIALDTVDLVVDSIHFDGATVTASFNYTVTVRNDGTGAFEYGENQSAATVRGWFKANPGFPDTPACQALLVDTDFVLPAGGTFDVPISCDAIPTHGQDYLYAEVDSGGSVPEYDETNNVGHRGLPQVNLFVAGAQLHGPNADFAFRYTVSIGLTSDVDVPFDLGGVLVAGRYSTDDVLDANDNPACGVFTPARTNVSPGDSLDVTIECSEAPGPNDRFVIVRIDAGTPDRIAEFDEVSDNHAAVAIPAVDLTIENLGLEPPNISYAHSWTAVIRNIGYQAVDVSAVIVQGFYSADAVVDIGDDPACAILAGGLLAGYGTAQVLVNCSAAPEAEHAYLIALVDYGEQVSEANEANNSAALLLPGADLAVQEITLFPDASPGALIYGVEVENLGPEAVDIGPTVVRGWFSVDNVLDGSDVSAGGKAVVEEGTAILGFGESITVSLGAPTPDAAVNYLIVEVDADHTLLERDESNNVFTLALKPDLAVTSVTVLGAFAGDDFAYSAVILNAGDTPFSVDSVPVQIQILAYMSDDDVLDPGEAALAFCGTALPAGLVLDPGETYTAQDGCSGGTPDWGSDHLIVKVDPGGAVVELDEANNAAAQLLPDVDLLIEDVIIDSTQLPGFFGYNVRIRYDSTIATNIGSVLVTGTYSADSVIDGSDNPACSERIGADFLAAPGQTVTLRILCSTLPSSSDFHLLVTVDASNDVHESDETNNRFDRSLIFVS